MPKLTIILIDCFELDESYIETYLTALREWNAEAMKDVELICISQRQDMRNLHRLLAEQPFQADLVKARHPFVDGYPIWDTMQEVRPIWDLVHGQYVTFNHPEYTWGPGRVRNTLDWLERHRPYLALGNLRRPGTHREIVEQTGHSHGNDNISAVLQTALFSIYDDSGRTAAAKLFEEMQTSWWMFWTQLEQPPGPVPYIEDVFFADREWLDAWRFTEWGGEMPFQDVYDLLRIAMVAVLPRHDLLPQCFRMDQTSNRMIHLQHPKAWMSWTPAIRDWFLAQPERWKGTLYSSPAMWCRLIEVRPVMPKTYAPMNDLRNGPGGTVTRYSQQMDAWMAGGGKLQLADFYAKHGREKRER